MRSEHAVRVYLFDDDPDIQLIVQDWLEESPDFEFVGGRTSEQDGFAEVAAARPHVVLLDHMMPGSMGIDAAVERLRELTDAKILLFSGFPAKELSAANASSGADGFVTKGAGADELLARLREVTGGRDS